MSVLCCVCHVFPPLVSIFGLFPVLVRCDYWLILVQPCLSNYLWFICVFLVLSVQFDFVWSTRYSRCFLSVSFALSSPDVLLKTIIWVYVLVCVFLYPPRVCTVTHILCKQSFILDAINRLTALIYNTHAHIFISIYYTFTKISLIYITSYQNYTLFVHISISICTKLHILLSLNLWLKLRGFSSKLSLYHTITLNEP